MNFVSSTPETKPIKKQPNKFTVRVPIGKIVWKIFGVICITENLAKVPKAPNKAINK
mgnify:FL=1